MTLALTLSAKGGFILAGENGSDVKKTSPSEVDPLPALPDLKAPRPIENQLFVKDAMKNDQFATYYTALKKYARERNWKRMLETYVFLREFLASHEDENYVLKESAERYTGAMTAVSAVFNDLPPEAYETFEEETKREASELYKTAVDLESRTLLYRLAENYPMSSDGVNAAFHLAGLAITAGEWDKAERLYEKLSGRRSMLDEADFRRALVSLAVAKIHLGRVGSMQPIFERIESLGGQFRLAGRRYDASALVKKLSEKIPPVVRATEQVWQGPGGTTRGDGLAKRVFTPGLAVGGVELEKPGNRWGFSEDSSYERLCFPAVSEDTVYLSDLTRLSAASLDNGAEAWKYSPGNPTCNAAAPNVVSAPSVKKGRVYSTFFVEKPRSGRKGWVVACLDAAAGDEIWRTGVSPEFPDNAVYVSRPVVSHGTVYLSVVTRELESTSLLLALDARTGEIRWSTFIASGTKYDPWALGLSGSVPVVGRGRVYLCTNMGAVVALDAASGRIDWLVKYQPFTRTMKHYFTRERRRWAPGSTILSGGRLFAAPQDSTWLLSLDADTGEAAWRFPRVTYGEGRYIVDCGPSSLAVLGDSAVLLDKPSGRVLWNSSLPGPATGRGVSDGRILAAPTADTLVKLSLASGKEMERVDWEWNETGGQTVFTENRLLSVSDGNLTLYETYDNSVEKISREKGAGRQTMAGLLARTGELEKAVALYRGRENFLSESARGLYSRALLKLSGKLENSGDFAAAAKMLRKRADLFDDARSKTDARFDLAELNLRAGDYESAVLTYAEIIKAQPVVTYPAGARDGTRAERIAEWEIDLLLNEHGRDIYQEMEKEAEALARVGENFEEGARFENFNYAVIRKYPNSIEAREAYMRIAKYRTDKGEPELAAKAIEEFLSRYQPGRNFETACKTLANLYRTLENRTMETRTLRFAVDAAGRASENAGDLRKWALDRLDKMNAYGEQTFQFGGPLSIRWMTPIYYQNRYPSVLNLRSEASKKYYFVVAAEFIECRRNETGTFHWRYDTNDPAAGGIGWSRNAVSEGNAIILDDGDRIVKIDAPTGKVLWSHKITRPMNRVKPVPAAQYHSLTSAEDFVYVASRFGAVTALSMDNGHEVWEYDAGNIVVGTPMVINNSVVAAVSAPPKVLVFKADSGEVLNSWDTPGNHSFMTDPPLPAFGNSVFIRPGPAELLLYDCAAGKTLWTKKYPNLVRSVSVCSGRAVVLVGSGKKFTLIVLDEKGETLWEKKYENQEIVKVISGSGVSEGRIFPVFLNPDRSTRILALSVDEGAELWKWEKRGVSYRRYLENLEISGEYIVLPYSNVFNGEVSLVNVVSGAAQVINFQGKEIVNTALSGDALVVSTDRNIYGFASLDRYAEKKIIFLNGKTLASDSSDHHVRIRSASAHFRLGNLELAESLLVQGLLAESVLEDRYAFNTMQEMLESVIELSFDREKVFRVPYLNREPVLDGEPGDDYPSWTVVELDSPSSISRIVHPEVRDLIWHGKEDLSARVSFGWNKKKFYIYVDVSDNIMRAHDRDADNWIGDLLLMAIDFRGDGGMSYRPDDELLSLGLVLPRKRQLSEEEQKREEERKPEGEYFVKRKEDNSGLVYEAALPWSMFKNHQANVDPDTGPHNGFTFGINIVVIDDDLGTGAWKTVSWSPGAKLHLRRRELWRGYIPEQFVKIRLDGRPGEKPAPGEKNQTPILPGLEKKDD